MRFDHCIQTGVASRLSGHQRTDMRTPSSSPRQPRKSADLDRQAEGQWPLPEPEGKKSQPRSAELLWVSTSSTGGVALQTSAQPAAIASRRLQLNTKWNREIKVNVTWRKHIVIFLRLQGTQPMGALRVEAMSSLAHAPQLRPSEREPP